MRTAALAIACLAFVPEAGSQATEAAPPPAAVRPVTFGVGERAEYQIKYGFISGGSADMEITEIDTVRGRPALHAEFTVRGGIPGFRVNDRLETWVDLRTYSSLPFKQDLHDGSYERHRQYDFLLNKRMVESGKRDTVETVEHPIDDASILYFIRTIALSVGMDTSFDNYFLPDRNPVRIRVLRKERISVPAGDFDAIVVQPIIKTKGIFSEGGRAEVWLSDDDRHIIIQVKSKVPYLPVGSLNLFLKSYRPPTKP